MKTVVLLCLVVCSIFTHGAARADEPAESYAVVALVGDAISIVYYKPSVGSYFDQNATEKVSLADGHFDQVATRAALNAIHRSSPGAALQGIALADRAAFGDADALFGADGNLPALLSAVKPLLRQPQTRYLIVVSKYRGDARLNVSNGKIGSGKLSGLGFYVDADKRMKKSATGEIGRGFVAPFAYVQVTLIDLETGAVVRSQSDEESATRSNVGSEATLDPWQALSAEQKVRLLGNVLGRAVGKTVTQVIAPS